MNNYSNQISAIFLRRRRRRQKTIRVAKAAHSVVKVKAVMSSMGGAVLTQEFSQWAFRMNLGSQSDSIRVFPMHSRTAHPSDEPLAYLTG